MEDTDTLEPPSRITTNLLGEISAEEETPVIEHLAVRPLGVKIVETEELEELTRSTEEEEVIRSEGVKPTADETPWRSKLFVTSYFSADGNDYSPGEPIPLIEAVRQAMALPDGSRLEQDDGGGLMMACPDCKATPGKNPGVPGHRRDCTCGGCIRCETCDGFGQIMRPADAVTG